MSEITIYGYDKNNKVIAVSGVNGGLSGFLTELSTDQGWSLMKDGMIASGDTRHHDLKRTLVCITGGKQ